MNDEIDKDEELSMDDFNNLKKHLEKKNKSKYKFLLNGGKSYQKCLFRLFMLTWSTEVKPTQWDNTVAHQLYKGKGVKSKLSNHRFIHTKDEIPKSFEHILMTKAKPKIVEGCSKFQIGAIPKHQSQEHLFTLKSVMESPPLILAKMGHKVKKFLLFSFYASHYEISQNSTSTSFN